ncbi:MAG: cytochrome b [Pseudomonadota bacterium]
MSSSQPSTATRHEKYSQMAIALHWIVAALILALMVVGYYFNTLPEGHDSRGAVISWHKSIGLTAVVLIVLRLIWRLTHQPPKLPDMMPAWQRTAAKANAVFLYLLMLLQPLLGYLSTSYSGYSTRWFGIALPKWAEKSPELNQLFSDAHHLGAKLLILALVLHVGGAALHALVRRDGVINRMLP